MEYFEYKGAKCKNDVRNGVFESEKMYSFCGSGPKSSPKYTKLIGISPGQSGAKISSLKPSD